LKESFKEIKKVVLISKVKEEVDHKETSKEGLIEEAKIKEGIIINLLFHI
jgi:hypothetical protein